ncbi:DUF6624 domain-containing protein [Streptomyces sp. NPDC057638]|uniref:DUF6624 domain-containing protein n=1 Tax=Streptomyces sp. NPDC057638 TaxID=3346190 RepID=UPI0036A0B5D1
MSAPEVPVPTILLFTRWGTQWRTWCPQPARDRPLVPGVRCENRAGASTAQAALRAAEEHGHHARLLPQPPAADFALAASAGRTHHIGVVDRPFTRTGCDQNPGRWLPPEALEESALPGHLRTLLLEVFDTVADAVRPPGPSKQDAALRRELLDRQARDQAVRLTPQGDRTEELYEEWRAVDRGNTAWLRRVIAKHGWPGRTLVGKEAAGAAWLLAQHADRSSAFQEECLDLLARAVTAGDADARHGALLEDRVRVNLGQPQVFGTQLAQQDDGTLKPFPMIDPPGVEERRIAWGFEPLADYIRSVAAHQ